jgi:hypothetical protein
MPSAQPLTTDHSDPTVLLSLLLSATFITALHPTRRAVIRPRTVYSLG